jgi:hypothetical protein
MKTDKNRTKRKYYLQKMYEISIHKQGMNYKIYGRRDMGRPRKRWSDLYIRPGKAIS